MLPSRLLLALSALAGGLSAVATELPSPYNMLAAALISAIAIFVKEPKKTEPTA